MNAFYLKSESFTILCQQSHSCDFFQKMYTELSSLRKQNLPNLLVTKMYLQFYSIDLPPLIVTAASKMNEVFSDR